MSQRNFVVEGTADPGALLGLAFESAPDPTFVIDPRANRIVDANEATASLLRIPATFCARPVRANCIRSNCRNNRFHRSHDQHKGRRLDTSCHRAIPTAACSTPEYSAVTLPVNNDVWLLVTAQDIAERHARV